MKVIIPTAQLRTMLTLQDKMNSKVNPQWLGAGYSWTRAIMVEGVEAIEHHGWKWWKKQEPDMAQLRMELVDIWHFGLSDLLLQNGGNIEQTLGSVETAMNYVPQYLAFDVRYYDLSKMNLLEKLDLLVGLAAARFFDVRVFLSLLPDVGMSGEELFRQYVGKNVLNFFRQDHGYKDGSYEKVWDGREDNEHLVELMRCLFSDTADYPEILYRALQDRYRKLNQQKETV